MLIDYLFVFIGILFVQILFFIFAAINKTDKVTDLSYGITFIIGGIISLYISGDNSNLVNMVLLLLICIWGSRLSIYLFVRVIKIGKDKRFDGIRENLKKFGSFWALQAVSVYIIMFPVIYILLNNTDNSFYVITYLGFAISILGIAIEATADYQKYVFKNNKENAGKWIQTGLWKFSRHPNYLGEILMWVGVFIYSARYLSGIGYLSIVSTLYIIFLLVKVTGIPTLEKEYEIRYKNDEKYKSYKSKTGRLFPKILS